MPQTKVQKFVFGCMMAIVMVYGMEVYNSWLRLGLTHYSSLIVRFDELATLTVIVYLLQTFVGYPLARMLTFKLVDPRTASHMTVLLVITACTVLSMCPMMSLVATLMFKGTNSLLATWFKTTAINFPMAFLWQTIIAGPLVRRIYKRIFSNQP